MNTRLQTTLGFAVACLLILMIGITSHLSTSKLVEDAAQVSRSLELQSDLNKLFSSFMDAQNSMRGYALSKEAYYLHRFQEASSMLTPAVSRLRELVRDNALQKEQVEVIAPILAFKLQQWDHHLQKSDDLKVIASTVLNQKDNKAQDSALRNAIEAIMSEESRQLAERTAESNRSIQNTYFIITLGGVLALISICVAGYIVQRDSKIRRIAELEREKFFTSSLDLLCISGMDGYFKRISPAFTDVLGFSLEEMYKTPILEFVHPDDLQKTLEHIKIQEAGESVSSFENRFRCKDGSYRHFSWKSVPLGDQMYGSARDVTADKDFQADLLEAQKLSQLAMQAKSEFLANMSHEIRTPLYGIIGTTDILHQTPLAAEQERLVKIVKNSGDHLLKIVNEILDFSKIEAGKLELDISEFNIRSLVETQMSLMGAAALEKNLEIKTVIDETVPKILRGDAGRIGQVMINLLNNAIKFTEKGHITLKVELEEKASDTCRLRVTVIDTGIGMSFEQSRKLFSPFKQADGSTARKYGGTGLGLSISKQLTELMGGSIGVESRVDRGSTFWFTLNLPFCEEKSSPPSKVLEPPTLQRSLKVLVAEDNTVNQMIIKKMLEKIGHTVLITGNGQEAVDAFTKDEFDLILMDHHMPVMDGLEAATIIRRASSTIPIIAFTANILQEDQKKFMDRGMNGIIQKPVTLELLQASLDKLLYPENRS